MDIKWNRKYKIPATEIESSHEDGLRLTGFFIVTIRDIDKLEELYTRRFGSKFNTEDTSGWIDVLDQINNEDPDEAFKGIKRSNIERYIIDLSNDTSLDEFEYIDQEYKNDWLESRCDDYDQWRFERICEALDGEAVEE